MNRIIILLFVVFVSLFTTLSSSASDIPGGIVYSNGKDAVYYDLGTKESKSLTSDYSQAVVKHPFAISDNGKILIWMQATRIYKRDLPNGIPIAVPVNKANPKKIGKNTFYSSSLTDTVEDMIWQRAENIKNLTVSPDGTRFAFDQPATAIGWVCSNQGNPGSVARLMAAGSYNNFVPTSGDPRFGVLPLFEKINDLFNGIFILSTTANRYSIPTQNPFNPVFGNVVERPPVALFKATYQDLGLPTNSSSMLPIGNGKLGWLSNQGGDNNDSRIYTKSTIKKNASFFTFQKQGGKRVAFIYQIGNQWGPIEIKTVPPENSYLGFEYKAVSFLKKHFPEEYKKPRDLEIQTTFPNVDGLAWKPDGSLTIFSQGKVFMISYSQIDTAFERSSVKMIQNKEDGDKMCPVSMNNILQPKLELIVHEIVGTCFNWVSNTAFLYLGSDNNVYLWDQGNTEKVAEAIGPFCYCNKSPFDNIDSANNVATTADDIDVATPAPISVTTPRYIKKEPWEEILIAQGWQLSETLIGEKFEINGIKIEWLPGDRNNLSKERDIPAVAFRLSLEFPGNPDMETMFIEGEEKGIQNPWEYKFSGHGQSFAWTWDIAGEERATLLVKSGEKSLISIKPIRKKNKSVQFLWKSWAKESPPTLR